MVLATVLTLRLAPHGLVCDYRYGCIWITTPSDAKNWRDPTGVAEIKPARGTLLAAAWDESVTTAFTTAALAEVLTKLAQRLAIEIDTTQIAPTPPDPNAFPAMTNTNGLPFRHALGLLLNETGCRCKLDGEMLVILPPDNQ